MNNLKKRIFGLLLALVMAMPATVPAFAANTSDKQYDFDVNALNFNVKTGARTKENSTPVYCYVTNIENHNAVKVRALGYVNSSTYDNKTLNGTTNTIVSYVKCSQGVKYSVHTSINEDGYPKAQLAFNSYNIINSERIKGVWSPDSAGTYTDAWQ
ncbi:MAG: hypothetical protein ACI4S0_01600 [Dorea sp.]